MRSGYEHKNDPSASLTEQLDKLNTLDMLSLIVATGTVGDAIWQDDVREAIEQAVMEAF